MGTYIGIAMTNKKCAHGSSSALSDSIAIQRHQTGGVRIPTRASYKYKDNNNN